MSCGVVCRRGSDPALPVATAPTGPLAWEPPYDGGAAPKKKKRQKKKRTCFPHAFLSPQSITTEPPGCLALCLGGLWTYGAGLLNLTEKQV